MLEQTGLLICHTTLFSCHY